MRILLFLSLLPLTALANQRYDYAREWPLTLGSDNAGAYRVFMNDAVYRSAHQRDVLDIDVFNADGEPVAAALFAAEQPMAQAASTVELPWFELPAETSDASDLHLVAERNADGTVRRIEARVVDNQPKKTAGWLIDASRLHEKIEALELAWAPIDGPLEETVRVEGSNDLRSWRVVGPGATLLDLQRDGRRLVQRRIELQATNRYLRIVPSKPDSQLSPTGVTAELARTPGKENWKWMELEGERVTNDLGVFFDFTLPGRFPVERVDVSLPGNSAVEWTLQSRESNEGKWAHRAGPWMSFQVSEEGKDSRSSAQSLRAPVRDRLWRLTPRNSVGKGSPRLRLAYRPEAVVFLAQGSPPFSLAAGSATARRSSSPLSALVDALRQQRGDAWQPTPAYLSEQPTTLSGERALQPTRQKGHWTRWLLWSLLVAGAVLVAIIAGSLLFGRSGSEP